MNEIITVYSAEMLRRLQSRTFWIGLLFGLFGVAVMMKLPGFLDSYAAQNRHVLLVGSPSLVARAKPLLAKDYPITGTLRRLNGPAAAEMRSHRASAIVTLVRARGGLGVRVYARDPSEMERVVLRRDLLPLNLELATTIPSRRIASLIDMPVVVSSVSGKFGSAAQANTAKVVAYVLLILLYLLIMVNSQLILSSVAEEKTSRIAELLVAAVRPSALLAGKIAASGSLAVLQMIVWVTTAYVLGMHATPLTTDASSSSNVAFSLSGISPADIAGFAIFFVLGFLQTATLFAAIGSLINRTEDLGSASGPLFLPVIGAFLIAIAALEAPESPAVVVASFVPLIAPFVMFARIVVSSVPFWQVGLSLAINLAAIWALAVLGGKIYRIGMMMYGRAPNLRQIIRLLRS